MLQFREFIHESRAFVDQASVESTNIAAEIEAEKTLTEPQNPKIFT